MWAQCSSLEALLAEAPVLSGGAVHIWSVADWLLLATVYFVRFFLFLHTLATLCFFGLTSAYLLLICNGQLLQTSHQYHGLS